MAIYYRTITVGSEPSSPSLGDVWIAQVGDGYQAYMWLKAWIPWVGGGLTLTETNADTMRLNVVVQEAPPDDTAQAGWIWIKESVLAAYLCFFGEYISLASA